MVRDRVARIVDPERTDDETLHSEEDELYDSVLRAIRDGAPNASELATEALKTKDATFSRWYA